MRAILLLCISIFAGSVASAQGVDITPVLSAGTQSLQVKCDSYFPYYCYELCGNFDYCEVKENTCRSCAGTQGIRLKRVLDEVGTEIVADANPTSMLDLMALLKTQNFISLHAHSIYNFSSDYDGDKIRAQFRMLCHNTEDDLQGILLIETHPITHQLERIAGAFCPATRTRSAGFYPTNASTRFE